MTVEIVSLLRSSFEDITYSGNFMACYFQNFISFTTHLVFNEDIMEASSKTAATLRSLTSYSSFDLNQKLNRFCSNFNSIKHLSMSTYAKHLCSFSY